MRFAALRQIELIWRPRKYSRKNILLVAQFFPQLVCERRVWLRAVLRSHITCCSSSGFSTGSIFNITVSIRLKIAVFAPIPSANESTATIVMMGVFVKMRKAYLVSCKIVSNGFFIPSLRASWPADKLALRDLNPDAAVTTSELRPGCLTRGSRKGHQRIRGINARCRANPFPESREIAWVNEQDVCRQNIPLE